jgi:hypothetical protein
MKHFLNILLALFFTNSVNDYSYVDSLTISEINELLKSVSSETKPTIRKNDNGLLDFQLKSKPKSLTLINYNNNENGKKRTTYFFDQSGNLVNYKNFMGEMLTTEVNCLYDSFGYKMQEITSSPHFAFKTITNFEYNSKGNKIYDNESGYPNVYIYDESARLICKINYSSDSTFLRKKVFYYDAQNKNIEIKEFIEDQKEIDLRIEKQYNSNSLIELEKYFFSKRYHGEPMVETIKYEYKYDSNGNYIEKTRISDKFPPIIEKRIIEYY